MKGLKAIIAGAGTLSLTALGVFGGGGANATSAVYLTDNPDSASSVTVKHKVTNGLGHITTDFGYRFAICNNTPDLSSPPAKMGVISFDNVAVDENNEAEVSISIDMSDIAFGAAGTYEFCINESSSSDNTIGHDSTNRYKFYVDVFNEKDANEEYTGNLVATLLPQALNMETGEKGEAVFTSEQSLSHIEVTHRVLGDKANFDQYFGYYLKLDKSGLMPEGTDIAISGIDEYYVDPATGETKENLTSIKAGEMGFVFLKKDQTAIIGVDAEGNNRLPINMTYDFTVGNMSHNERLYSSQLNDDTTGLMSLTNSLALVPGENASEQEITAFNRRNKILVTRKMNAGVSTGVVTKLIPFVALMILGGAAVLAAKLYSDKIRKNRAE